MMEQILNEKIKDIFNVCYEKFLEKHKESGPDSLAFEFREWAENFLHNIEMIKKQYKEQGK